MYAVTMQDRIRKGAKPHVYLREWRKAKLFKGPQMAEFLGIARESYLRLEREPHTLSVAELIEIADIFGVEHQRLWAPPPPPGLRPRPSLDEIVADQSDNQVEGLADMLRRAVGKPN